MRRAVDSTACGRLPRSFQARMRFTAERRVLLIVVESSEEDEGYNWDRTRRRSAGVRQGVIVYFDIISRGCL